MFPLLILFKIPLGLFLFEDSDLIVTPLLLHGKQTFVERNHFPMFMHI